jgi:hypothetical protein
MESYYTQPCNIVIVRFYVYFALLVVFLDVYGTEIPKVFNCQTGTLKLPSNVTLDVSSVESDIAGSFVVRKLAKSLFPIPSVQEEKSIDVSFVSSEQSEEASEYSRSIDQDSVLSFIREGNLDKEGNIELANILGKQWLMKFSTVTSKGTKKGGKGDTVNEDMKTPVKSYSPGKTRSASKTTVLY